MGNLKSHGVLRRVVSTLTLWRVAGVFDGHSVAERVLEPVCGVLGEEEGVVEVLRVD